MNITAKQLACKPKKVGELEGDDVMEVQTKGGLTILVVSKKDKTETIGLASHPAIARHIAQKDHPTIEFTSLEKSEMLPEEVLMANLPEFLELTRRVQELEK